MSLKAIQFGWNLMSGTSYISDQHKIWFGELAKLPIAEVRTVVEKRAKSLVDEANTWSDDLIEKIRDDHENAATFRKVLEELDFYVMRMVEISKIAN